MKNGKITSHRYNEWIANYIRQFAYYDYWSSMSRDDMIHVQYAVGILEVNLRDIIVISKFSASFGFHY